ncbi:restriction endonuclease subunit S [Moorella sulfitireducens]|uniref:restriction endonuclease subunit S n=1 Tax=Neomoorella sulfitireducens TaxID=2972948 RepID=UPI003BF5CC4F
MKYGKMPKKQDLVENGYPVFSGYGIVGSHKEYLYEDPEIVVIARGVGGCGDIKMSPPKAYITNLCIVLTIKDSNVLKKYLYYRLLSTSLRSLNTGAAQPQIVIADLNKYKVKLPPLQLQRKIAAILSAYDDLIENNTRRIKILEEMARLIYREWFVKFRFPGHEKVRMVDSELGPIPEGWEVRRLSNFGNVVTGKTPSKAIPEYYGDYMPFIKTPDMHGNVFCILTSEMLSERGAASQKAKTLPPNSLCVSCIGTAGVVSITCFQSQTNQQINSIIPNNLADREFLYFTLKGLKNTINQFGANGATMINLNKSKFEGLKVVYPSKELVFAFHEITYPIFELIKKIQMKNLILRRTRDLLLPKLISGELDVEDLDIAAGGD